MQAATKLLGDGMITAAATGQPVPVSVPQSASPAMSTQSPGTTQSAGPSTPSSSQQVVQPTRKKGNRFLADLMEMRKQEGADVTNASKAAAHASKEAASASKAAADLSARVESLASSIAASDSKQDKILSMLGLLMNKVDHVSQTK